MTTDQLTDDGMTNEEKLGMAMIALLTPALGYAMGGKQGAMAGLQHGASAAGNALSDAAKEEKQSKREAKAAERALEKYEKERKDRITDAGEIEKAKQEARGPDVKPTRNALGQVIDANTKEVIDANKTPPKAPTQSRPQDVAKGEDNLQRFRETHPITKRTMQIEDSYKAIKAASPTAAGDLSLIFQYMKMLDPGSVVREGEFANAQNSAGVPDRIRNLYNRSLSGERLNDDQRKQFLGEAEKLRTAQRQTQKQFDDGIRTKAKARNLDPEMIIVDPYKDDQPAGSSIGETKAQDKAALNWVNDPKNAQDPRLPGIVKALKAKGLMQ